MANLTVGQVLLQVDALLPNQYTTAEKLRWLAQAEGFVRREIWGENGDLPALTAKTALCVPAPYDEMYRYYVESQIHYANAEMTRYNNASTAWNNAFLTYRDYIARTRKPDSGVSVLRLC